MDQQKDTPPPEATGNTCPECGGSGLDFYLEATYSELIVHEAGACPSCDGAGLLYTPVAEADVATPEGLIERAERETGRRIRYDDPDCPAMAVVIGALAREMGGHPADLPRARRLRCRQLPALPDERRGTPESAVRRATRRHASRGDVARYARGAVREGEMIRTFLARFTSPRCPACGAPADAAPWCARCRPTRNPLLGPVPTRETLDRLAAASALGAVVRQALPLPRPVAPLGAGWGEEVAA